MVVVVVEGNVGKVVVVGNVTEDAVEVKWLLSWSMATLPMSRSWAIILSTRYTHTRYTHTHTDVV